MTKRKSLDMESIEQEKKIPKKEDLYITSVDREPTVEDFLPSYKLIFEGIETNAEAEEMAKALEDFIKSNPEIALQGYNSKHAEGIQEGFARAIAISELFFNYIYID